MNNPDTNPQLETLLVDVPREAQYAQGFFRRWRAARTDRAVRGRVYLAGVGAGASALLAGSAALFAAPALVPIAIIIVVAALVPPRSRTPLGLTLAEARSAAGAGRLTDSLDALIRCAEPHSVVLAAATQLWAAIYPQLTVEALSRLRGLLIQVPAEERSALLSRATLGDDQRFCEALLLLADDPPEGVAASAQQLAKRWAETGRLDPQAEQLYQRISSYGGVPDELHRTLTGTLLTNQRFAEAEPILESLAAHSPDADTLYELARVAQALQRDALDQERAFRRFIDAFPSDPRVGTAWLVIGEAAIAERNLTTALHAFEQAEAGGTASDWLRAYRRGSWDELVGLEDHPDRLYPPAVVIDLEVDPLPDAPPGSRVFEAAAVRMKGATELCHFHTYIARDFTPTKWRKAPPPELDRACKPPQAAAHDLIDFIAADLVVGHNLRAFDAKHLRGMGVAVADESIVDTLELARCLFPDSLHHHLSALCGFYGIELRADERHTALPDARATAALLRALGDDLVSRDKQLLQGFRALTPPESALDRVLLAPRGLPADPSLVWQLSPGFGPAHITATRTPCEPSDAMRRALSHGEDTVVEINDRDAAYVSLLDSGSRTIVAVGSRSRIERILAAHQEQPAIAVLPNPDTTLSASALTYVIGEVNDPWRRLQLFCMYQASHNHDAATLYPFRIPADDLELRELRAELNRAVPAEPHTDSTDSVLASLTHTIILATHGTLLRLAEGIPAARIIIDDVDELVGRIGEHVAVRVTSDQVQHTFSSQAQIVTGTSNLIEQIVAHLRPHSSYRERIPLGQVSRTDPGRAFLQTLTEELENRNRIDSVLNSRLRILIADSTRVPKEPGILHAQWLEVTRDESGRVTGWAVCGVSVDPAVVFGKRLWEPYRQHIICGPATRHSANHRFLERVLGIPPQLPTDADQQPVRRLLIPAREALPPLGLLNRDQWTRDAACILFRCAQTDASSIVVNLSSVDFSDVLARSFQKIRSFHGREVMARALDWSSTRIADRLTDSERRTMAFVSPRSRRTTFDGPVSVEVSGPLRFQNQRDPLVAAAMRAFSQRFPEESVFQSYQLPIALLELKARLSSAAEGHLLLDTGLFARSYRDEILQVVSGFATIHEIGLAEEAPPGESELIAAVESELSRPGDVTNEDDQDLLDVLRTLWGSQKFNTYTGTDGEIQTCISQGDVIRTALQGKDQLLIIPTGGGKSLCYQIPGVLLTERPTPEVTLVFSPLIALMADQLAGLHRLGIFSATLINSSLAPAQREERLNGIERGDYSIIYLAPEQIHSPSLRARLAKRKVGLVVLDEAHCLSQWGHDFRTDYFLVRSWVQRHLTSGAARSFPILAVTATARASHRDESNPGRSDETSTVHDIVGQLGLRDGHRIFRASTERAELRFAVEHIIPKPIACLKCGAALVPAEGKIRCTACGTPRKVGDRDIAAAVEAAKIDRLVELLGDAGESGLARRWRCPEGKHQRGLVYCAYTRTTEQLAELLSQRVPGLRVDAYHGKLSPDVREAVLQRFTDDSEEGLHLVVATNAFGMGIDVRRLGFVVHFDVPGTLEAYYQEAGRAGRDSFFKTAPADCVLLYHPSDLAKQRLLHRRNTITPHQIEDVYDALLACLQFSKTSAERSTSGEDDVDIYISEANLAQAAGVEEGQIKTILFYLEQNGCIDGKPVLKRGEMVTAVWNLRFEQDYEQQIAELPPTSRSWPLLDVLRNSEDNGLTTEVFRAVPLGDLAESIGWMRVTAEEELLNLVRRRIVAYRAGGRIGQVSPSWEDVEQKLRGLPAAIEGMLYKLSENDRSRLRSGDTTRVNLADASAQLGIVQVAHLCRFLAQEETEPNRVFEFFRRDTRSLTPDRYSIRLWSGRGNRKVRQIAQAFCNDLIAAVEQIKELPYREGSWIEFDIFQHASSYRGRRDLNRRLVILAALGLIRYVGDPALERVMRLQLPRVTQGRDRLTVELKTLRLKETYDKHKLKMLEHYVGLPNHEEREGYINDYFHAEEPLVQRVDTIMRAGLLKQQEALVRGDGGIVLVEGPAGCGKTTVLIERIKYLVTEQQVSLDSIMVTAHYNSAVGRIDKELEMLRQDGSIIFAETVNKFGARIFGRYREHLRRFDGRPHYQKDPTLLRGRWDEVKRKELHLLSRVLTRVHKGEFAKDCWPADLQAPSFRGPYRAWSQLEDRLHQKIVMLRQYGLFPRQDTTRAEVIDALGLTDQERSNGEEHDSDYGPAETYAIYRAYLESLSDEAVYTFDDQVLFALAILRQNPSLHMEFKRKLEHIIIDEFQDFTLAQTELFSLISEQHGNIMVFGDLEQSIRPNKGRSEKVFADFRTRAASYYLSVNFRSTQEILDLAMALRDHGEQTPRPSLIAHRGKGGYRPEYIAVRTEAPLPDSNTLTAIIDTCLSIVDQLPNEHRQRVALISSLSPWSQAIQRELRRRGRTFSIMEDKHLYQRPHFANVLVYCHLIAEPSDEAYERLLRHCLVPYIDDDKIQRLREHGQILRKSLGDVVKDSAALTAAGVTVEQRQVLDRHLKLLAQFEPTSTSGNLFTELEELPDNPILALEGESRKIEEVREAITQWSTHSIADVIRDVESYIAFLDQHRGDQQLVVTTIDNAKSEEFETVIIIGANHLTRYSKKRLYVCVSRAADRLFLVCDEPHGKSELMKPILRYCDRRDESSKVTSEKE